MLCAGTVDQFHLLSSIKVLKVKNIEFLSNISFDICSPKLHNSKNFSIFLLELRSFHNKGGRLDLCGDAGARIYAALGFPGTKSSGRVFPF